MALCHSLTATAVALLLTLLSSPARAEAASDNSSVVGVKYTLNTTYLPELPGYSTTNTYVLEDAIRSILNGTNPKVEVEPVAQHISGPGTVPTTENPLPTPNVVVSYDVKKVRDPAATQAVLGSDRNTNKQLDKLIQAKGVNATILAVAVSIGSVAPPPFGGAYPSSSVPIISILGISICSMLPWYF